MQSGQHSDGRINQMFSMLERYLYDRIPESPTTNSTFLRVDKSGNNSTAVRGEIHKPFLTIQAAVTAASGGDTILIGPGTYAESVTIPAALTGLHIIGTGVADTFVAPAAGPGFTWTAAGAVMTTLSITDLVIMTAGGADNIAVDATAQPTSFALGLYIERVIGLVAGGTNSMTFTNINSANVRDCAFAGLTFLGVANGSVWNSTFSGPVALTYTEGTHIPSQGNQNRYFYGCQFASSLGVNSHEKAHFDSGCVVAGNITAALTNNVAVSSVFEFHGEAQGSMTLTIDTLAANRTVFNLQQARLTAPAVALNASALAGAFRAIADCQGAVITTTAAGGIITGARCNMNLLGATFDHTANVLQFAGGADAGTCNRDVFRSTLVAATTGGGNPDVLTFAASFGPPGGPPVATIPNFNDANFSVNVEQTVVANDPLITAKGAAGFTITDAGAGDPDVVLTVIHD